MHHKKYRLVTSVVGGVSALALTILPTAALAQHQNNSGSGSHQQYISSLLQLNNSGARGLARLTMDGRTLTFNLSASGLTPGKVHPMHIHGKNNPEISSCPTTAADVNHDGFISVLEGAPAYGRIKVSLTSPQTPFGTPPTPALFFPFAGTANNANFPVADAQGRETFSQTYAFDNSDAAQQAFTSLMPLENQHIVLHGADAPKSVDAAAFAALGSPVTGDLSTVSYDALLPVACGQIMSLSNNSHHGNNGNGNGNDEGQNEDNGGQTNGTSITNTGNNVHFNTGSSEHTNISVRNDNNAQVDQSATNNLNTGNNQASRNIGDSGIFSGNTGASTFFSTDVNANSVNISGLNEAMSHMMNSMFQNMNDSLGNQNMFNSPFAFMNR